MLFLIVVAAAIVAFLVVRALAKKHKADQARKSFLLVEQPQFDTVPEERMVIEKNEAMQKIVLDESVPTSLPDVQIKEEKPKSKKTSKKKEGTAPKMSAKKKTTEQSK